MMNYGQILSFVHFVSQPLLQYNAQHVTDREEGLKEKMKTKYLNVKFRNTVKGFCPKFHRTLKIASVYSLLGRT